MPMSKQRPLTEYSALPPPGDVAAGLVVEVPADAGDAVGQGQGHAGVVGPLARGQAVRPAATVAGHLGEGARRLELDGGTEGIADGETQKVPRWRSTGDMSPFYPRRWRLPAKGATGAIGRDATCGRRGLAGRQGGGVWSKDLAAALVQHCSKKYRGWSWVVPGRCYRGSMAGIWPSGITLYPAFRDGTNSVEGKNFLVVSLLASTPQRG